MTVTAVIPGENWKERICPRCHTRLTYIEHGGGYDRDWWSADCFKCGFSCNKGDVTEKHKKHIERYWWKIANNID